MLKTKNNKRKLAFCLAMIFGVMIIPQLGLAQSLNSGLAGAASQISGANAIVSKLVMAIGGIIGLIGGIRVYIKWNNGEREIQKEIVGWAGACVFLIMTGVVLNAFGIA